MEDYAVWIVVAIIGLFVLIVIARSIRIIPQASAGIVERLGRYHRTLDAGLALIVPFVDHVRPLIDLREQVVSFPPQPVITADNLVVSIDSVIYFQVTDAEVRHLRDRQLHPGDRAAHGHDLAQRRRRHGPRAHADLPRGDQPAARAASSTRPPASGASASTGSRSRRSTRPPRCSRRWRCRCGPSVRSARRSSPPRGCASRRS